MVYVVAVTVDAVTVLCSNVHMKAAVAHVVTVIHVPLFRSLLKLHHSVTSAALACLIVPSNNSENLFTRRQQPCFNLLKSTNRETLDEIGRAHV